MNFFIGSVPETAPFRVFRELANRLQLMDNDIEKTLSKYYASDVKTEEDKEAYLDVMSIP